MYVFMYVLLSLLKFLGLLCMFLSGCCVFVQSMCVCVTIKAFTLVE